MIMFCSQIFKFEIFPCAMQPKLHDPNSQNAIFKGLNIF